MNDARVEERERGDGQTGEGPASQRKGTAGFGNEPFNIHSKFSLLLRELQGGCSLTSIPTTRLLYRVVRCSVYRLFA